RRGDPQFDRAARPALMAELLPPCVAQAVGGRLLAQPPPALALAGRPGPAVADHIAQVEEVAVGLVRAPDLAEDRPFRARERVGPRRRLHIGVISWRGAAQRTSFRGGPGLGGAAGRRDDRRRRRPPLAAAARPAGRG